MKICVINTHTNNFGDDAACVAMAEQIREDFPNAHIDFVYNVYEKSDPIPFSDSKTTHYNELPMYKNDLIDAVRYLISKVLPFLSYGNGAVKKTADIIKSADFVISAPCGANIGIYKDWIHLLRVLMAVLEGHIPIIHLNTVGKSDNFIFNLIAKYALKRSKIYVREAKSLHELKEWGIIAEQGVDTAFSLKDKVNVINSNSPYLAFIPTQFDSWHKSFKNNPVDDKVLTKITEIVEFCNEHNVDIRIIPHLTGVQNEEKLLLLYKELFIENGMEENRVFIEHQCVTFWNYEEIIKNSDIVLSMRYHGVIFSIKNAIPFLSLSYENKMVEACKYSEMESYSIDITEIDKVDIKKCLADVYENKTKISNNLKGKREMLNRLSRLPVQGLKLKLLTQNKNETSGEIKH
ncbi:polysaccharide pyruvyl transferase family protein [Metabacillus bambusae]|uniref:Polysaccharide pyruvyl transferase family protein n=1 Tax=Metabacillus bambusae TaxID=2795218 RepID=A0ABS3N0V5_9BACI|nr:polysaccharide pyruvyl transferase family protein [Metabacillus bambusae]MBO1511892.1 polysaccharide pyruvyl transferase family protein [Metabacillus bambusae]